MPMSELKQRLLKHELAAAGYPDSEYRPASDKMWVDSHNNRMPDINDAGDVRYSPEYSHLALHTVKPIVDRVNEITAAWELSYQHNFKDLLKFRIMAEYNDVVLAGRDDTELGRGFNFVVWRYNSDRTGFNYGDYTTNYAKAKEDFVTRAGLIPREKLLSNEQAAEVRKAIQYRLDNDGDMYFDTDEQLQSIIKRLINGYSLQEPIETPTRTEIPDASTTTQGINGEIQPGDWVLITASDAYENLMGKVEKIIPRGSPNHSGGETDDVHVDITVSGYTDDVIEEIGYFITQKVDIEELRLFDLVLSPDNLINITDIDMEQRNRFVVSGSDAEAYCKEVIVRRGYVQSHAEHSTEYAQTHNMLTLLFERLNTNITDYHNSLPFSKGYLIDQAWEIAAKQDAYDYMTEQHVYEDSEVEFLLSFQKPLDVVADEWARRRADVGDLSSVLNHVTDKKDALQDYALMPEFEPPSDPSLRRFMTVDLVDFVEKVAQETMVFYHNDFEAIKNELMKSVHSDNPEDKRKMLHFCDHGYKFLPESDVYIKGSAAYDSWQHWTTAPCVQGYYIEITQWGDAATVYGNVYEIGDYAEHAKQIAEAALPCAGVTLLYSNNDVLRMDKSDYDAASGHYNTLHGATPPQIFYSVNDNLEMADLLNNGHLQRLTLPIGNLEEHLQKLSGKLAAMRNDIMKGKAEHEAIVATVQQMDYGMEREDFENRMSDLLPAGSSAAMSGWIAYADDLDMELSHPKAKSLLEYAVEFDLIKQHYGDEIALQVFNLAEKTCLNVFELRGAAKLLKDGEQATNVHDLVLENELYMTESEDYEFGKAIIAFVERKSEQQYAWPENPTEKREEAHVAIRSKDHPDRNAKKPKQSIEGRLRAAQEKVNSQSTPDTPGSQRKKRDTTAID